jgi:hypothetical protein
MNIISSTFLGVTAAGKRFYRLSLPASVPTAQAIVPKTSADLPQSKSLSRGIAHVPCHSRRLMQTTEHLNSGRLSTAPIVVVESLWSSLEPLVSLMRRVGLQNPVVAPPNADKAISYFEKLEMDGKKNRQRPVLALWDMSLPQPKNFEINPWGTLPEERQIIICDFGGEILQEQSDSAILFAKNGFLYKFKSSAALLTFFGELRESLSQDKATSSSVTDYFFDQPKPDAIKT